LPHYRCFQFIIRTKLRRSAAEAVFARRCSLALLARVPGKAASSAEQGKRWRANHNARQL
jgi:hypothetical protein